jgi:diguanylate cyclase (GGDEF) domain
MTDMRKILVVDNEETGAEELARILRPFYDVMVAENGRSAIALAEKHAPDLILLDTAMPSMTGFDVIRVLKGQDSTRYIPVIFVTESSTDAEEEKGLLLGAVDYIAKPFKDFLVKARVQTHMQVVDHIRTLERLCLVDALTGIPNRRQFDAQIVKEWKRAKREVRPVSLLMLDIDKFKNYNDTYGHLQGDVLLRAVARIQQESLLRPDDFVARWGGEEFAVILPDTDLPGALQVAERIRAGIEVADFPDALGNITKTTISIGVSSVKPNQDADLDEFITSADNALFKSKNEGRNRISAAQIAEVF